MRERFTTTAWSGGETTELCILPRGASYALRDFHMRISMATVALAHSVFTNLPGVARYISPLEGAFILRIDDRAPVVLHPGEILGFDGGAHVECEGYGRDLNLMLRGRAGSMAYGDEAVPEYGETCFVFAREPLSLRVGREKIELPCESLLRVDPEGDERLTLQANAAFYAFLIKNANGGRPDER